MRASCEPGLLVLEEVEYEDAVASLAFGRDGERWVKHVAHDERACSNFRRHAEEMVLQTARMRPVPWEEALEALLKRAADVDWWLAGSCARAIRAEDVSPRDVDVVTDAAGARQLARRLEDVLVEPLERADWIADWWLRAFLHARIEIVGDVHADVDEAAPVDFGPYAAGRLEAVRWRGHELLVPPLDLQREVARRRGR